MLMEEEEDMGEVEKLGEEGTRMAHPWALEEQRVVENAADVRSLKNY